MKPRRPKRERLLSAQFTAMKSKLLTASVLLALTLLCRPVTAQIQLSDRVGKLILKDLAELDRRRKEAFLDSMSISALNLAYDAKGQALTQARTAIMELEGMRNDDRQLLIIMEADNSKLTKEVRTQKRLKWLAIGGMGIIAILAITN